jgi:hypothetical protein
MLFIATLRENLKMSKIIPSGALVRGSQIWVEGIPAIIESATISSETLFDKLSYEFGKVVVHPSGVFKITGEVAARIASTHMSQICEILNAKQYLVNIKLGNVTATFFCVSVSIGLDGVLLKLQAESVKYQIADDSSSEDDQIESAKPQKKILPIAGK